MGFLLLISQKFPTLSHDFSPIHGRPVVHQSAGEPMKFLHAHAVFKGLDEIWDMSFHDLVRFWKNIDHAIFIDAFMGEIKEWDRACVWLCFIVFVCTFWDPLLCLSCCLVWANIAGNNCAMSAICACAATGRTPKWQCLRMLTRKLWWNIGCLGFRGSHFRLTNN